MMILKGLIGRLVVILNGPDIQKIIFRKAMNQENMLSLRTNAIKNYRVSQAFLILLRHSHTQMTVNLHT